MPVRTCVLCLMCWALAASACSSGLGGGELPTQVRHISDTGARIEVAEEQTKPGLGAKVRLLEELPPGFRKKYRATGIKPGQVDITHWKAEPREGYPSAEDPHRYIGKVEVSVDVKWGISPPQGAERADKRQQVMALQLERAKAAAALRGANAIILMRDDMVKDDESWFRNAKGCRGRSRCIRQTFVYNVLYVAGAEAPAAVAGEEALAALVPEGYRPAGAAQPLAAELALPLKRGRCYALGIAIESPDAKLPAPVKLRLQSLTVDGYLLNGKQLNYKYTLDTAFARAAVAELGCSPITEKQVRKLSGTDKGDTSPLRWWLYEKPLSPAEATKTYCYQCSGDANACGSIKLEACEPLLRCLKPRRVSVAQCRKAYPTGY